MRASVVVLVLVLVLDRAHADPPPAFYPWSVLPEISGLADVAHDRVEPLVGAQLRVRYAAGDPSVAYSAGIAAETLDFDTFEPSLTLGIEPLHQLCHDCDEVPILGTVRLEAGGGAAWNATQSGQPFAVARLSAGLAFERRNTEASPFHLSAQLDVVVETQLASDGTWRVSFGVALDPFRIAQDASAFNQ
ncbi:MAG TPA: hypothetical protein VGF94_29555 [Kofleriaceae bacterium]|jgi:hypothetical protein